MLELFHGSTIEVSDPLVRIGRSKVDFGQGVYLTTIKKQARDWAVTLAGRSPSGVPVLNSYRFDRDKARLMTGDRYKIFEHYSLDWLDYVIDCRRGGKLQKQYDVVEGGVANDRVIDTVEDFEKGIITAEQALGQLKYKRVNQQIAILSQSVIDDCLEFIGSCQLSSEGE